MVKRNGLQFPQMTADSVAADSKKGMEILFAYARNSGLVVEAEWVRMAKKYGVATDGAVIRLPVSGVPRKTEGLVK